ncbi:histidine kinase dimerization/phosphoacceptor domain-containing protein [Conexibacter stalactiti]|uniref:histidine kinase n=1 Tax=Conexibacter stalactiti TaxID=1940611 RepID=A0ABU4HL36_9ACTN|nr:histidine kinase dimerization/phosphoacceptor domain-containing protein [Conexibacter stalactiti]MDW5594036.1 histidine kinase dimerization/phosphoacceptor domain-containing protein [Conexibacter stalactiti]MEC5034678.1 histidine kinase dimerization/phosphoacceptor domain-containing protein [Conexibacter stalactiti]
MSELAEHPREIEGARWQQWLLPGALREREDGRRSPRDWFVDVLGFLIAIGLGLYLLGLTEDEHSELALLGEVVLGTLACLSLWLRRRWPFGVALATGLASILFVAPGGAAVIATFCAVIRVPWRQVALLVAIGVTTALVIPAIYPTEDDYPTELLIGLLFTGFVVGWALFVRVQRELFLSMRERTARLETAQQLRVEQAREAERRRIAREMHDVLAHRLALLSLHAGALEFRPDAPPAEIAQAAGVVRASARAALEELREVIGVLREQEPDDDAPAGSAPEPPQPTLVQIPALVERSRATGMRIGCRIELDGLDDVALPDVLGRTAYRIVQEGLTNAHKHAPAAAVEVVVEARAAGGGAIGAAGDAGEAGRAGANGDLLVAVLSRRPIGAPPAAAAAANGLPGAGTGLVGLGERVALAGGALEHGPDANGDFLLRATLPLPR